MGILSLLSLVKKIPGFVWLIAIGAGIVLGFIWYGKLQYHNGELDQQAAESAHTKYVTKIQKVLTTQVVTQYRDRIKVIHEKGDTIIKKVPVYVSKADSKYHVSNGFVELWNAANTMQVPNTAKGFNEASSDVVLTDVATQHARESLICHNTEQQLISIQDWVRKMQEQK